MFTGIVVLWIAVAALLALALVALIRWLKKRNIVTRWYDWLVGAIGLLLFLFTLQNFYGGFIEDEPLASWMFLVVTGIPSLVLIGIVALQIWRRSRTAS